METRAQANILQNWVHPKLDMMLQGASLPGKFLGMVENGKDVLGREKLRSEA